MYVDVSTKVLKPHTIYEFDGSVTMYGVYQGRKWIVNGNNIFDAREQSQLAKQKIDEELACV
jgi:hypothetical protein